MKIFNHKAQYLSEYAIVFSVVLAALIGMQTYIKRGLQGRHKDATDAIVLNLRAETADAALPLQYEPYYVESDITTIQGTAGKPNTTTLSVAAQETTTAIERTTAIGAGSYRKTLAVAGGR